MKQENRNERDQIDMLKQEYEQIPVPAEAKQDVYKRQISACANNSGADAPDTEPPYWMRIASAVA